MSNTFAAWVGAFPSFIQGLRLIDGGDLQQLVAQQFSAKTGITALAGGGQTGATPLPAQYNRVDTAGAGGTDSVMLPLALPGAELTVKNASGQSIQVFGQPNNPQNAGAGDTIAAASSNTQVATGTGVSQANTKTCQYQCFALGQWQQNTYA